MAITVPERVPDQVKIAGVPIEKLWENRENFDGGPNDADHAVTEGAGRIHDFGISDSDFVNQNTQIILRQDVKPNNPGPPGLIFHKNKLAPSRQRLGNVGGVLLTDPLNVI